MRKVIKSFPRLPLEIFIWPKNFLWNIYYFQKEAKPTRNWWYPAHYRDRLVICQLIYDLIGLHLYVKEERLHNPRGFESDIYYTMWILIYNFFSILFVWVVHGSTLTYFSILIFIWLSLSHGKSIVSPGFTLVTQRVVIP